MPQHPLIAIPLDIPAVRIRQTEITKDGERIRTVESTLTTTTCRRCGRAISERYSRDEPRLLCHLPSFGRVMQLRIRPTHFRCPFCDDPFITTPELDWYDPNALHTKAYERHLIVQLVNNTVTDIVAKEDVSYDALLGILDRWIATTIDWHTLRNVSSPRETEFNDIQGVRTRVPLAVDPSLGVVSYTHDRGYLDRARVCYLDRVIQIAVPVPDSGYLDIKRQCYLDRVIPIAVPVPDSGYLDRERLCYLDRLIPIAVSVPARGYLDRERSCQLDRGNEPPTSFIQTQAASCRASHGTCETTKS